MSAADHDGDQRPRVDLTAALRPVDPEVAQEIALMAVDADLAPALASAIAPFAGVLADIARSMQENLDRVVAALEAPVGADDVAAVIDELFDQAQVEYAAAVHPNEPMQRVLDLVASMFEPMRDQMIEALIRGDDEFEPDMPPVFLREIGVFVEVLERERPTNWPGALWLQAVGLVISHGIPIVGVVPKPVVERCLAVAAEGGDPFDAVVDAATDVLAAIEELATDELVLAAEPDLAADLAEVVGVAQGGWYSASIRSAFAVVDAILYKREFRGYDDYRQARIPGLDDVTLPGMRSKLVRHCLAACYEPFQVAGDAVPASLNRHAFMHGVDRSHATLRDVLFAGLLAATLVESEVLAERNARDAAG